MELEDLRSPRGVFFTNSVMELEDLPLTVFFGGAKSVLELKDSCLFFVNVFFAIFKLRNGTDRFALSRTASWRAQKTFLYSWRILFQVLFEKVFRSPFSKSVLGLQERRAPKPVLFAIPVRFFETPYWI